MKGKFCDVCNKDDIGIQGIFASSLGPISFAYCPICAAMRAEPEYIIGSLLALYDNDLSKINTCSLLTYYDMKTDTYIDKREGNIPIEMVDGTIYKTRSELVKERYKKSFD